jgi:hypothetical protein
MVGGNLVDINYEAPGNLAPSQQNLSDYLEVSTSLSYQSATPPHNPAILFNSPRQLTIPQRRFGMDPDLPDPMTKTGGLPKVVNGQFLYPIFAAVSSPYRTAIDQDVLAAQAQPGLSREGSDVLITDVISFAVIPIFSGFPVENFPPQNQSFPRNAAGPTVSVFDTWSNHADDTYDYTLWDNADLVGNPADPHLVPCKTVQVQVSPSGPTIQIQAVLTGLQISIRVFDSKTTQTRQITIMQDL